MRIMPVMLLCLYLHTGSFSATYYVDPVNGDNTNSGISIGAAFKTLEKARDAVKTVNSAMTADITVYLRGGWYLLSAPLAFDNTISGTNGYSVIFTAYPGEHPVISGGRRITGWTIHDAAKNIWKAAVPGLDTRQLYINCVRAIRAHKGSGLSGAVQTSNGYTTTDQTMQNWGNISDIEFVYNGLQGGTAGALWIEKRCGVAGISGTTITMKTPGWTYCSAQGNAGQSVTTPTDIENAFELLDQPGEWYLDRQTSMLYYMPRHNEDLSSACVIAPVLDTLISGIGTLAAPIHNVQFKGITFAHATWLVPNTGDGFPEDQANFCSGTIGWPPGNIIFRTARKVRFEGCIFKHLGGANGLDFSNGCQNNEIVGCCFADISGNCIKIGTTSDPNRSDTRARDTGNTVIDCYIHDSPCEYHGGVGLFCGYVSSVLLSHNEICNTSYSGISCGWGWGTNSYAQGNQFTYNNIHHFCMTLGDGGGIYTLSNQPDTKWRENWIHDMPSRTAGGAIYPDEGSGNMEIYDNVCSAIGNKWLHLWTNSIHDINIHDIFSSTNSMLNNGTNCPVTNLTVITNGIWPQAAKNIMDSAGIESAYQSIKTAACACSLSCPGNPASIIPSIKSMHENFKASLSGVLSFYTLKGELIKRISIIDLNRTPVFLSHYTNGIYLAIFTNANKTSMIKRVVVDRTLHIQYLPDR